MPAEHDELGRFVKGTHWRERKPHWDAAWLSEMYLTRGLSAGDIASICGCTDAAIMHWLRKHSIPRRDISSARALKKWGLHGERNGMYGRTGSMNPRYVDGGSPERQRLYVRGEGRRFLQDVRARDNHMCVRCGAPRQGKRSLHVHHIKDWAGNPELRFDMNNVVSLCQSCHSFVHSRKNTAGEYR